MRRCCLRGGVVGPFYDRAKVTKQMYISGFLLTIIIDVKASGPALEHWLA